MGAHEKIFEHLMKSHHLEGAIDDPAIDDFDFLLNSSTQELLEFHADDHAESGDKWYPSRGTEARPCSHRHKPDGMAAIYREIFLEIATGDPESVHPTISFTAIQVGAS